MSAYLLEHIEPCCKLSTQGREHAQHGQPGVGHLWDGTLQYARHELTQTHGHRVPLCRRSAELTMNRMASAAPMSDPVICLSGAPSSLQPPAPISLSCQGVT